MAVEGHLHRMQQQKSPRRTAAPVPGEGVSSTALPARYQPILNLQRTIGNRAVTQLLAQRQVDPLSGRLMREESGDEAALEEAPIMPIAEVERTVPAAAEDEIDHGRIVHLEGLTQAHFSQSSNSFQSENTRLTRARTCEGDCSDDDPCVNVATTIVSTYSVPITVDLPDLDAMDLNECERQQAQNWINTVLAPHEQQHVQKFRTYNGTTRRRLTFTACNSQAQGELDTRAEEMLTTEQASRQASAQALSDALDPFNFDFEINCPEPEEDAESSE